MLPLTEQPGGKLRSRTTRHFVLSLSTVYRGDICSLEGMGSCLNGAAVATWDSSVSMKLSTVWAKFMAEE